MKSCFYLLVTAIFLSSKDSIAQKNIITFGFNVTNFSDWKNKPLNFFNPEFGYSRQINEKYRITNTSSAFWASAKSADMQKEGAVVDRLIMSNDVTLDYTFKSLSLSMGPSIRYRHEKKILYFYPQPNPFEIVIDPKKSNFDIGAVIKAAYNIKITRKSLFVLKISYKLYNKGVNPLSFAASYGWAWN